VHCITAFLLCLCSYFTLSNKMVTFVKFYEENWVNALRINFKDRSYEIKIRIKIL